MIKYVDLLSDTICSPISAPGYAGVSVIRICGDRALEITKFLAKTLPQVLESHKVYLSKIQNKKGSTIDEVLITYFKKNKSFTGDETVEIACHGNPLLVNQIIETYLTLGARAAERGEFSFRAFYNGKLDLVQAESIHSLVTTNTQLASHNSLQQLKGNLSEKFKKIEEDLVLIVSHLEATIDFVEQDISPEDYLGIETKIIKLQNEVNELLETYNIGKNLNKGQKVLLLGTTNVGKSSLFNCLFNEERAIVTDVPGTTRDLVRGQRFLGNYSVEFIDSAGIRNSSDEIEQIGIKKSLEESIDASLIVYVVDILNKVDLEGLSKLPFEKTLIVINKIDLDVTGQKANEIEGIIFESFGTPVKNKIFRISALNSIGIDQLQSAMGKFFVSEKLTDEKVVISQARQFNHLSLLASFIDKSLKLIKAVESPDLISQELSLGLMEINQLLGKEYNDEILDKIFRDFCIGK